MQDSQPGFLSLAVKTAVCHTITYFVMGAIAFNLFHYAELIASPCSGMKPLSDPLVKAGPLLQPLRGVLFATVFYPLRSFLFGRKYGWLLMSWILVGVGILGTFAAPAGSLEGFIYSTTPVWMQLRSYLEIVTQAVLLSALLCYWVNNPGRKWLSWVLGIVFCLLMSLSAMALLMPRR
jgi:hypothetical protein